MEQRDYEKDIESIIISEEQLKKRVAEIGEQLSKDYEGKTPIVVCILKGSIFFYSDICRAMNMNIHLDFMSISSYGGGTTSSGIVRFNKDLDMSITGRDVIIVEDIIDSGRTMKHLTEVLWKRNPSSIKIVCLLDKEERREVEMHADYVGFACPNAFVVGYGLDYDQDYRNLPYIGVLSPRVYGGDAAEK